VKQACEGEAGGVLARPRRDLRAGWRRKRLAASPEQPGLLRLRARGNHVVWRRARRRSRADRDRKRPTASPKQPGFLKLQVRGNDAVQRRAACDSSCRRQLRNSQ
jgi:hypothetical protein